MARPTSRSHGKKQRMISSIVCGVYLRSHVVNATTNDDDDDTHGTYARSFNPHICALRNWFRSVPRERRHRPSIERLRCSAWAVFCVARQRVAVRSAAACPIRCAQRSERSDYTFCAVFITIIKMMHTNTSANTFGRNTHFPCEDISHSIIYIIQSRSGLLVAKQVGQTDECIIDVVFVGTTEPNRTIVRSGRNITFMRFRTCAHRKRDNILGEC